MKPNLLRRYMKLAEFLGRTLGPDYEIVLHDLEGGRDTIVAIANGHVSGRGLDSRQEISELKQLEADRSYETQDYKVNYSGVAVGKKILRTSSFYIKDDDERLLGLLCINFDDQRYQRISNQVLKLCHPDSFVDNNFIYNAEKALNENISLTELREGRPGLKEVLPGAGPETIGELLNQVLNESGLAQARLTQRQRLYLVELLKEKGAFLIKGAVKQAAGRLGCSPATIYRYLGRRR